MPRRRSRSGSGGARRQPVESVEEDSRPKVSLASVAEAAAFCGLVLAPAARRPADQAAVCWWRLDGGPIQVEFDAAKSRFRRVGSSAWTFALSVSQVLVAVFSPPPLGKSSRRRSSDRMEAEKALRRRIESVRAVGGEVQCRWCGESLAADQTTLDHVIPISRSGTSERENLAVACQDCNEDRGDYMPEVTGLAKGAFPWVSLATGAIAPGEGSWSLVLRLASKACLRIGIQIPQADSGAGEILRLASMEAVRAHRRSRRCGWVVQGLRMSMCRLLEAAHAYACGPSGRSESLASAVGGTGSGSPSVGITGVSERREAVDRAAVRRGSGDRGGGRMDPGPNGGRQVPVRSGGSEPGGDAGHDRSGSQCQARVVSRDHPRRNGR
jgi:hypothetical protein